MDILRGKKKAIRTTHLAVIRVFSIRAHAVSFDFISNFLQKALEIIKLGKGKKSRTGLNIYFPTF